MRKFDQGSRWNDVVLNLFGQHSNGRTVDPGVSLIHFVLWKYILISLVRVAKQKQAFDVREIISYAKKRLRRRISSAETGLRILSVRAESRGIQEPHFPQYNKWIRGIGKVESGNIILDVTFKKWLYEE